MARFILINGAPRSGKDTIAMWLYHFPLGKPLVFDRFSMPHKQAFAAITNTQCDKFGNNSTYEPVKDSAIVPDLGVTYRQWQIDFSEKFMKPLYGESVFGRLLLERTKSLPREWLVVVPDCGFQVEVDCLTNERCLFLSLTHPGTDYSNDSRSAVRPASNWMHINLKNDRTKDDLQNNAIAIVSEWLNPTVNGGK